jgi:hypothetical protein
MRAAARHGEDPRWRSLRDRSLFGDLVDDPRFVEPLHRGARRAATASRTRATLEALRPAALRRG